MAAGGEPAIDKVQFVQKYVYKNGIDYQLHDCDLEIIDKIYALVANDELDEDFENENYYLWCGRYFVIKKENEQAIKYYELCGDNHIAKNNLGIIYYDQNEIALAMGKFEHAVELNPDYLLASENFVMTQTVKLFQYDEGIVNVRALLEKDYIGYNLFTCIFKYMELEMITNEEIDKIYQLYKEYLQRMENTVFRFNIKFKYRAYEKLIEFFSTHSLSIIALNPELHVFRIRDADITNFIRDTLTNEFIAGASVREKSEFKIARSTIRLINSDMGILATAQYASSLIFNTIRMRFGI
jgi:tetratricopeptide (TPR) repeat protein